MKHTLASLLLTATLAGSAQNTNYIALDGTPIDQAYTDNRPYMEMYTPEKPCGAAIIICPGGGYQYKTMDYEGRNIAPFFCQNGITVFVLSYTLPYGNSAAPLASLEEAMRGIAGHARVWGIDPRRIGVMGSSAGGHLATTLATAYHADTQPAFQILLYPVVSMDETITHAGSRTRLLGETPDTALIRQYSNELQVKAGTPPAYIMVSQDDNAVPIANSLRYCKALTEKGIPAELHIVPTGGHGWGSRETFAYHDMLLATLQQWIETYVTK